MCSSDLDEIRSKTPDHMGVDIAIEAVGTPATWELAFQTMRRGGTVNCFGGCPSGSSVRLDTSLLHYSEISLHATFHHTPAFIRKALETIARGDVRATDLITGEEPLSRLPQLMRDMVNRNGNIKTAIIP